MDSTTGVHLRHRQKIVSWCWRDFKCCNPHLHVRPMFGAVHAEWILDSSQLDATVGFHFRHRGTKLSPKCDYFAREQLPSVEVPTLTSSSHSGLMLCMRGTGVMMLVLSLPKLLSSDAWSTTSSSLSATRTCASPHTKTKRLSDVCLQSFVITTWLFFPCWQGSPRSCGSSFGSYQIFTQVDPTTTYLQLSRPLEVVVSSQVDAYSCNFLALWLDRVLLRPGKHKRFRKNRGEASKNDSGSPSSSLPDTRSESVTWCRRLSFPAHPVLFGN